MAESTAEIFDGLLENLKVDNAATIAARRDEIAKALNKHFRDLTGSVKNQLMVGSYGRYTAVRGVSDLDMLYLLPQSSRDSYASESGPRRILERVRDTLKDRYPNTDIKVDQCVVRVQFTNFKFEVQPVFEEPDGSFLYPDTVAKKWKLTKPRDEISETRARDERTGGNMRRLAKMVRAWRDTHGVVMGGLLIDTLVHRFFTDIDTYDSATTASFDTMSRDFFEFLKDEDDHDYYRALGSNQHVRVKKRFQPKAKKAHDRCLKAIDAAGSSAVADRWRDVFGTAVPKSSTKSLAAVPSFRDTEQYIEQVYPVDIRHEIHIDCRVTQNGFRASWLRDLLKRRTPLLPNKSLEFSVVHSDVPPPYTVKWKVLNRGPEAIRRDNIRGQLVDSDVPNGKVEHTKFRGEHLVECYAIKDGVVVARDRIDVPIRPE